MEQPEYSVLMSVYHKDNPEWLKEAIDSILSQTVLPKEFVLVCDGFIGDDLEVVAAFYEQSQPSLFKVVRLPENVGLGLALRAGIEQCTYEMIARMDADDISLPDRIEKQLEKFNLDPALDVVGCLVDEFIGSLDNVVARVLLPETHEEIVAFAKKRNPIRHPSLLFRKSAVVKAGNYRDFKYTEDYELVVRMILAGKKFYNIPQVLHYMRINENFYKRRGGMQYLKNVYSLKIFFVKTGFFSKSDFMRSFIPHMIVALMPGFVRATVYNRFLRGR